MSYKQKVHVYQAADTTPQFIKKLDSYLETLSDINENGTPFDNESLKVYLAVSDLVGDYYKTGKRRIVRTDRFGQSRTSYQATTSATRATCDRYFKHGAHPKMQRLWELQNATRRRHAMCVIIF